MESLSQDPNLLLNVFSVVFAALFIIGVSFEVNRARRYTEYKEFIDWAHVLIKCLEKEDLTAFPKGVGLKGIHRRTKLLNTLGVHAEVSADQESLFIDHGHQTVTLIIH